MKFITDTNKKSRSEYFKNRRKERYNIYFSLPQEKGQALENHLKETNQTKTDWIIEKIDQDTKK